MRELCGDAREESKPVKADGNGLGKSRVTVASLESARRRKGHQNELSSESAHERAMAPATDHAEGSMTCVECLVMPTTGDGHRCDDTTPNAGPDGRIGHRRANTIETFRSPR